MHKVIHSYCGLFFLKFKKGFIVQVDGKYYRTIEASPDEFSVTIIDQTLLPFKFELLRIRALNEMKNAIYNMQVRGAPLIGVSGAFGIALACNEDTSDTSIKKAKDNLINTRPTAVNLSWAVNKLCDKLLTIEENQRAKEAWRWSKNLAEEDVLTNKRIGNAGLKILKDLHKDKINILTHCNAGWLATIDYGTALSPIYMAIEHGMNIHVWVDETRPRNQGMNLTAWELEKAGIPHTVVADNAGGFLMQEGMVDCVLVGADRVGVDGAVCNKIGTYLKALPAKAHKVPFYVAAPKSTFDKNFSMTNKSFEIEKRDASELFTMKGINTDGEILTVNLGHFEGYNPAFDITPPELITGIICEEGIIKPENLKEFLG